MGPWIGSWRGRNRIGLCVIAVALAGGLTFSVAAARADTTITLTTPVDETMVDGHCSLREALMYASGTPDAECSTAPASGTTTIIAPAGCYRLTLGQLSTGQSGGPVVLEGAGPGAAGCDGSGTVIDAQHASRVLFVAKDTSVSGLTVTGGVADLGGGIEAMFLGESVTLSDVAVIGNAGTPGIDASSSGGQGLAGGEGGGVFNGARLSVVNSTISDNTAGAGGAGGFGSSSTPGGDGGHGGDGGGISNGAGAVLTVTGSTISGNGSGPGGDGNGSDSGAGGTGGQAGSGGGIFSTGPLVITNSTISANSAGAGGHGGLGSPSGEPGTGGFGGGIDDLQGGAFLTNVTIAGNSATAGGDGINNGFQATETGSVIAGNGAQNCSGGSIRDGGSNITFPAQPSSSCPGIVADPRLGPLQQNGGPTATMALSPGSAAIGLVQAFGCVSADQRGVARPQGASCDAGAFEWAPPVIGAASATATGQTTAIVKATITNPDLQDARVAVNYGTTTGYGSTTAQQDVRTGAAAVDATVPVSGLRPGTLYHVQVRATNADGTVTSSDMTLVTASPTVPQPPTPAPSVTGFHQSAARWLEGSALARASAKRSRPPVGTRFTFKLNESATYVLAFTRTVPGRKVKGHCVAQTRRNRRNRSCSRAVPAGSLRFGGHAGTNKLTFQGRLTRSRRLLPGAYTVTIVATNSLGQRSKPQQLTFTIAPR